MKKFFALLLAVAMLLSCVAFADEAPARTQDIVIMFTSDVHCGIDSNWGYAGLYQYREMLTAGGSAVILVDNGDNIQGEPVGTMTTGEALIDLMNTMGYDVATMGNHEFDYGMDRFFELAAKANFPYVSANFNKAGELVFQPYVILERDGVKIAFVGVTTPKTLTSSTPRYFQDETGAFVYGFFQDETGELLYSKVQEAVDAARADGADYVIAMCHLGNETECQPWTYADVIANTTGIDVMVDGHSHDTESVAMTNKAGETVLRQGCGTKLEGIGLVTIAKDGKISAKTEMWAYSVSAPKMFALNNPMTAAVAEATVALNEKLATVVAKSDVDLVINDPVATTADGKAVRIVRTAETNLGDLCADAYRAMSGADVAVVNGGGVRVAIKAGDITLNDILKVHPFGNSMCVCYVTGQEILDMLEWSVHSAPGEFGGFLHVSGMTFTYDATIPSPCTTDENTLLVLPIEGERRVKEVMIAGEPLDPEKTYTLSSHNYMLQDQGDGFTMFADNVYTQESVMIDNQVLINYITGTLGGVVGAEYANPYGEGRIVEVNAQ